MHDFPRNKGPARRGLCCYTVAPFIVEGDLTLVWRFHRLDSRGGLKLAVGRLDGVRVGLGAFTDSLGLLGGLTDMAAPLLWVRLWGWSS